MSKKQATPAWMKDQEYPGFLFSNEVPPKLVERYPDGCLAWGAEYAKELDEAAAKMRRARTTLYDAAIWPYKGFEWDWERFGYAANQIQRQKSPDGLSSLVWSKDNEPAIRLREDGLLVLTAMAEELISSSPYLWNHLMDIVDRLRWSTCTTMRGVVVPDLVIGAPASRRITLAGLRRVVKTFRDGGIDGWGGRGGNNPYDFTRLFAESHPALPGRSGLFFCLVEPVLLRDELLSAIWPGAIVAEIRDDGLLALNFGMISPIERLGTMGRDSGADYLTPTYTTWALRNLWGAVCRSLPAIEQGKPELVLGA